MVLKSRRPARFASTGCLCDNPAAVSRRKMFAFVTWFPDGPFYRLMVSQ
jgi:hypothetical protein